MHSYSVFHSSGCLADPYCLWHFEHSAQWVPNCEVQDRIVLFLIRFWNFVRFIIKIFVSSYCRSCCLWGHIVVCVPWLNVCNSCLCAVICVCDRFAVVGVAVVVCVCSYSYGILDLTKRWWRLRFIFLESCDCFVSKIIVTWFCTLLFQFLVIMFLIGMISSPYICWWLWGIFFLVWLSCVQV